MNKNDNNMNIILNFLLKKPMEIVYLKIEKKNLRGKELIGEYEFF